MESNLPHEFYPDAFGERQRYGHPVPKADEAESGASSLTTVAEGGIRPRISGTAACCYPFSYRSQSATAIISGLYTMSMKTIARGTTPAMLIHQRCLRRRISSSGSA